MLSSWQEPQVLGYANLKDLSKTNLVSIDQVFIECQEPQTYRSMSSIANEDHQKNQKSDDQSLFELFQYHEWRKEDCNGSIFTERTGHSVTTLKDKLYLFCGSDNENILNDMHVFDIKTKVWAQIPHIGTPPHPRSGSKGVAYQKEIFYFGGYTFRKGEYFGDFYKFNVETYQWTLLYNGKQIPPRVDHSLVIFNEMIYIFGGSDGRNRFDDLYEFCIYTGQVNIIAGDGDIPTARFGHTSEIYRDQMFIFGGWNGTDTLNELYTYSFLSNYWYKDNGVTGIQPPSRYRHASTVVGSSMFIFGGVGKNQLRYDDLFEYNFKRREWRYIETRGNIPTARTFHQLSSFDNQIYLIGGNDGIQKNNDMYSIVVQDFCFEDFSSINELDEERRVPNTKTNMVNQKSDKKVKIIRVLKEQVSHIKFMQGYGIAKETHIGARIRSLLSVQGERYKFSNQVCLFKVFLDCGHRCCCYGCSIKQSVCQICFKKPIKILKIFTV